MFKVADLVSLSYILCYNKKSYNRTIEQKENTLNDVFSKIQLTYISF